MWKKQLFILVAAVIVILVLMFAYSYAAKNTINALGLSNLSSNQLVSHPAPGTLQIKNSPDTSELTVVDNSQPIEVNKDGFEVDVDMSAVSLKDNSPRSPNIILREAKSTQTYPLELQIGVDNGRHLQVAFIDLNQEDPFQRRIYLISNNSPLVTSNKLRIVEKASGNTQSFTFYDGATNSILAENISLPRPFFTAGSALNVGLYVLAADLDGASMTIKEFKVIKDSSMLHL